MNRKAFPSWQLSPLVVIVTLALLIGLVIWFGLKLLKYNYPNSLTSARDVPEWMVDGHYGTFTDADMLTLRIGQCSHDVVFIRPKADGTAVVTCGGPARPGPVLLFVADALDRNRINGRAGASIR